MRKATYGRLRGDQLAVVRVDLYEEWRGGLANVLLFLSYK